ncbi:MAG: DegT/DnrJ/EryC1/StrS family aminotransferase [Candidatus Liptonbacteria bacterium]|nr:DegT/DnrJ/EryC1/StrS family aminotransferase [Parcubacteria group bacterium]MBI4087334.1 DegT/DnrJ/EryC1/StrS family aminotransferase [Candidatus Liptonbacteria bacterium]
MPSANRYPIKIHVCEPDITELEIKYVTDAIKSKDISSIAEPVRKLENAFAERFGMKHAVAVNSGGSALFLALKALGMKPGDEVIVPDFTMIASAAAVSHCGAKPVFVDSSEKSFNVDVSKIEEKITPRTKMIMPVHLYGEPCDMDPIMEIAKKHNLLVVEDAAEAHGAKYKGRMVGTFGVANCFSFYANKIMTTGEGGMIVTNDADLANKLKHMRGYDFDDEKHFWHQTIAWNLRMSALAAALGLAQLKRLDELIEKRRANARYYTEQLKDVPGIRFFPEPPDTFSVFWMYGLCVPRCDELMEFLAKNGIETRTFFIPMHVQPVYNQTGDFKWSDYYGERGLYLPSSSHISKEEKDFVISKVKEFYSGS